MSSAPNYQFVIADSLKFLKKFDDHSLPVVVTGLHDIEELGLKDIEEYLDWFGRAAYLIFRKTRKDGYIIFIQTDRKIGGQWIDKSYHLTDCAIHCNWHLMWHKICLNRPVGSANLHRPTYSHILCYSAEGRPGNGLPDVVEAKSVDRLYDNATPMVALELVMEFLRRAKLPRPVALRYSSNSGRGGDSGITNKGFGSEKIGYQIIDPFVGQGSVVYSAVINGFSALGIDIDEDQILKADDLMSSLG